MKTRRILCYIFLVLSVAINVFIVVEGGINGDNSASQSFSFTQMFIDLVKKIDPNSPIVQNPEITHSVIRKLVGHFGLFGVSGILTTTMLSLIDDAYKDKKLQIVISSAFIGLFVAFLSELMQLFTPGRYMSFIDVLIDYSGYILFGGLTFLIFYLAYHHKKKKEVETAN